MLLKSIYPTNCWWRIRNLDDIYALLNVGCDKISVNSSAVKTPNLIDDGAKKDLEVNVLL